jgi:hypothetical protein
MVIIMTTQALTPIGKFRNSMTKFLGKLDEWALSDHVQKKEIEKFKIKYNMGMQANPRGSLVYFTQLIEPYAHHILQGDDDYFLGDHVDVDDEYHALSQQLKSWWPTLSDYQRNYVKKTFQLLLMQSAIATGHQGLRAVINQYRTPDNQLVY